jgi:L-fucose isomerase-like protein
MLQEFKDRYKLKIGFMPTRRNVFSKEEAAKFKRIVEAKVRGYDTQIVNLDFLNDEGLIYSGLQADAVADRFIAEKVDAVFAPHCNFGTEDAVAKAAKKIGKPVLLWGPRDEAPGADGIRMRDTQCGLFATSKALMRLGVPFTYITNSETDSDTFDAGYRHFLSTASVVKTFRTLRIGQIDTRPKPFWSVMYNEGEILEKFGIEVVPNSLSTVVKEAQAIQKANDTEYIDIYSGYKSKFKNITVDDDSLKRLAALKLAIRRWAAAENLSALGIQCWDALQQAYGVYPCFINGDLTDDGLPVSCETDILGAASTAMIQASMRGATPAFFADLTICHPEKPNVELLWHCGNFPHSLAKRPDDAVVEEQFGGKCPAAGRWEIKGGDVTLCKMDGVRGNYSLLMGHCKGTDGPATVGTYLWAEFKDWPKWEHKFIYGPYIHHVAGIHGKVAGVLFETCKYIPGLAPDPVEPTAEEIEQSLR